MTKGTTIPIQSFKVQHTLTHVTMPRLVHPHHTIETLDCTTGSHNPSQPLMHTRIGRLPLGPQTLTHGLLQCRELREADTFSPVRVRHRLTQGPQAGEGLTPHMALNDLYQLLLHPIKMLQRPR